MNLTAIAATLSATPTMSLARAALLARPRPTTLLLRQTRQSSSDTHANHDEHHHDAYEDHTEYPKEGSYPNLG